MIITKKTMKNSIEINSVEYTSDLTTEDLINIMTRELTKVIPRPKSLVRRLLNDFRNHVIIETKELPLGVSQWKEHGKKYDYWDYFKNEVIEEYILEAKNAVKVNE
ncbi:MAG: hypothetical protein WC511_07080 [Candidatus Pacearchaeota archaeon]